MLTKGAIMLSSTEVEFFKDQGYLKIAGLLSPTRIDQLRQLSESEFAKATSQSRSQWDLLESKPAEQNQAVFRLSRVMARHPGFQAVAFDSQLVTGLRQLIGGDSVVCINRHNMMIVKAARVGRQIDWHQDGWNWGHDNIISAMIFIDDSTFENGCLEIIPGVHKRGLLPMAESGIGRGMDLNNPEMAALVHQAVPIECRAGDALLFHSCTPHFSKANASDRSRRNLVFAYAAADDCRPNPANVPMEYLPLPPEDISTAEDSDIPAEPLRPAPATPLPAAHVPAP
jgi:phytanoyl-CoA hydroxylase